ncbi:5-(carboxyamino)imidazole ribonucleotide mutase, partial [Methylobacterium radiotolerans]
MASPPPVAIIMGSQSDWATMRHAAETLDALGVPYDARIVSAHRTPDRLVAFAKGAVAAGLK